MDMGLHAIPTLVEPQQIIQILIPGVEERARHLPPLTSSSRLMPGDTSSLYWIWNRQSSEHPAASMPAACLLGCSGKLLLVRQCCMPWAVRSSVNMIVPLENKMPAIRLGAVWLSAVWLSAVFLMYILCKLHIMSCLL